MNAGRTAGALVGNGQQRSWHLGASPTSGGRGAVSRKGRRRVEA